MEGTPAKPRQLANQEYNICFKSDSVKLFPNKNQSIIKIRLQIISWCRRFVTNLAQ